MKTRLALPLTTAALLLLAGCPSFGENQPVDTSNLRCDAAGCLLCENLTCYKYSCESDWQCPEGYTCAATRECKPAGPASSAASTPPGGGGPVATPPVECTVSADCGATQMCVDGACQTGPGTEPVTPPAPAGCTADADCEPGSLCINGACVSKTFPLRPEGTCQFNLDCGQKGLCINTKCYFPAVENHCPAGAKAVGGYCLPTLEPAGQWFSTAGK